MNFFHEYIYPTCMFIYSLWMIAFFIGWIHMILSVLCIFASIYDLIKGALKWRLRSEVKDVLRFWRCDVIGGFWTLIPGVAAIVVVSFLSSHMRYRYERLEVISGTYARVVHIDNVHHVTGQNAQVISDIVIDLGYGSLKKVVIIRHAPYIYREDQPPSIGDTLLVASIDGEKYSDIIPNRRICAIPQL